MITDKEIEALMLQVKHSVGKRFLIKYKMPTMPNSGHGLNFENKQILGTIIAWNSGFIEWEIVSITTEETLNKSYVETSSISEMKFSINNIVSNLFNSRAS
ncbi:MAG: hypothetical protein AAGK14_15510 [Verrucomicrobiota bacterium]